MLSPMRMTSYDRAWVVDVDLENDEAPVYTVWRREARIGVFRSLRSLRKLGVPVAQLWPQREPISFSGTL